MIVCKHYFSVTIYGFCVSCNIRALYFAAAYYEYNLDTRHEKIKLVECVTRESMQIDIR